MNVADDNGQHLSHRIGLRAAGHMLHTPNMHFPYSVNRPPPLPHSEAEISAFDGFSNAKPHPDPRAQVFGIGRDRDHRLGRRLEQEVGAGNVKTTW